MENQPLVAVIVAAHNNKQDTREFLEALKGISYENYKVVIIDDGSTDGTEKMLRQEYPEVIVLKGDGNLWWTLSVNMGIEKAMEIGTDYVLLTDNDTRVHREAISALVDAAESNPRSITFSKVYCYEDPERIYLAGWEIDWLKGGLKRVGVRELDKGQYDVQYDSKAANVNMLINTAFFQDLGMFDHKSFPQYWSDTDFTYRAHKKGYRIICEPKSIIWNKGGATAKERLSKPVSLLNAFIYFATDKRSPRNFRDTALFCWRHYPKILMPYVMALDFIWVLESSLALWGRYIIKQLQRKMGRAGD